MARELSAKLIRQHREAAGLRRERVAVEIDRAAFAIYQYESGLTTPPAAILGRLADLYGCAVDDFYAQAEAA